MYMGNIEGCTWSSAVVVVFVSRVGMKISGLMQYTAPLPRVGVIDTVMRNTYLACTPTQPVLLTADAGTHNAKRTTHIYTHPTMDPCDSRYGDGQRHTIFDMSLHTSPTSPPPSPSPSPSQIHQHLFSPNSIHLHLSFLATSTSTSPHPPTRPGAADKKGYTGRDAGSPARRRICKVHRLAAHCSAVQCIACPPHPAWPGLGRHSKAQHSY
jgi:hypothetical protein